MRWLFVVALAVHTSAQCGSSQDFSIDYPTGRRFTIFEGNGTCQCPAGFASTGASALQNVTAAYVRVTAAAAVGSGGLSVAGPTAFSGATTQGGLLTASSGISVSSGGLTLATGNDLNVGGASTLVGLLTASGGIATSALTCSGTATAATCNCAAFAGQAVPQPTIYYSAQPASGYVSYSNALSVAYHTGESLIFTPTWTGRYRVVFRQLVLSNSGQQNIYMGLSTSTTSLVQPSFMKMTPHTPVTTWTNVFAEHYVQLSAGTQYSWHVVFVVYSGSTSGTQFANGQSDQRNLCTVYAVAG